MNTKLNYHPLNRCQIMKEFPEEQTAPEQFYKANLSQIEQIPTFVGEDQMENYLNWNKNIQKQISFSISKQLIENSSKNLFLSKKVLQKKEQNFNEDVFIQPQVEFLQQDLNLKRQKSKQFSEFQQFIQGPNKKLSLFKFPQVQILTKIPQHISKPNRSIRIDELSERLQAFDLLLFKNQNLGSKIQRFIMGSQCDHIAIIVEYKTKKYILEAAGKTGVTLTDLNYFLKAYKIKYTKKEILLGKQNSRQKKNESRLIQTGLSVRLRRHQKVNKQNLRLLDKFISKCIGKKYQFHPMYLFSQTFQKSEDGFFCSQLVAQCLKYCQIVPNHNFTKPTYCYLPKHFWGKQWAENEQVDQELDTDQTVDFLENEYYFIKKVLI